MARAARLGDGVPDHERGSRERLPPLHRTNRVSPPARRTGCALGWRCRVRRRGDAVLRLAPRQADRVGPRPDSGDGPHGARARRARRRRRRHQSGLSPAADGGRRVPRGRHRHPVPRAPSRAGRARAPRRSRRSRSRWPPRWQRTTRARAGGRRSRMPKRSSRSGWAARGSRRWSDRGADPAARHRRRRCGEAGGRAHRLRAPHGPRRPGGAGRGEAAPPIRPGAGGPPGWSRPRSGSSPGARTT